MTNTQDKCNLKIKGRTTYGGAIYFSDFNTEFRKSEPARGSVAARRIAQAFRFDEQCRRNIINRKGGNTIA